MKLYKIVNPSFISAVSKLLTQEIPGRAAFKLRGIVATLTPEIEKYHKTRNDVLKKHCDKDVEGNPVETDAGLAFSGDAREAVEAELGDLGELDFAIETIRLSELGEKFSITGADAIALGDLIVE